MDEDVLASGVCQCLRHVASITDVDGKKRLITVPPLLANAKPLRSAVLVCVDDVRNWKVVARVFPWL